MSLKVIIFDLDNTLYDETIYLKLVFQQYALIKNINVDDKLKYITSSFRRCNTDILKAMLELIGSYNQSSHDLLFKLYHSSQVDIDVDISILSMLKNLKDKGYTLVILTNGVVSVQKNKIKNLRLFNSVDFIFYAREFGAKYEKPHRSAFQRISKQLGTSASSMLMIGDNFHCDILGAINTGLKAVYLDIDNNIADNKYPEIPRLHRLINLPDILGHEYE